MVKSYISAIKSVLKEDKKEISEDRFLLNSLIKAARFRVDKIKYRFPIQKPVLHVILSRTADLFEQENSQQYLAALYKAMFATAYYGLLRIGEVVKGVANHTIKAKDVHVGVNKNKMMLILRASKTHWEDEEPQTVKIKSSLITKGQHEGNAGGRSRAIVNVNQFCLFAILRTYIKLRPKYRTDSEAFFVFRDHSPVPSLQAIKVLRRALQAGGIEPLNYTFHSLRAGRSVDLLQAGVSVETIRKLRHWKSNAVFRYLK